jgi:hypothetical protein
VIFCSDPGGLLAGCATVAAADALVSLHHVTAELPGVLRHVARRVAFLPPVPSFVAARLRDCLEDAEFAVFGMFLAGWPATELAAALCVRCER